ncbi:MAG: tetratricopeptide repeat protein [Deltaproteobacteria bacterium]
MWRRFGFFPLVAMTLTGCPDDSLDRARKLEAEGRIREAGELYQHIAKKDPANLGAWDGAVDLWCNKHVDVGACMGVLDLELDLLGNVERHRDALSEVLELRARARAENGMAQAALTDLERAEKAGPERPTVYTAKARVLMMLGRPDEAHDALDVAKRLDPNNAEADALYKELPSKDPGFGGPDKD